MIEVICKHVTNGHHLTNDLISELCLNILQIDQEFLNDIEDRGKFYSYVYGMANIMFWKPKSKFFTMYRIDSFELIEDIYIQEEAEEFDANEYLNELGLDSTEKLWVKTCLKNNFNYSLVSEKTSISRRKISERINFIKTKYKK